MNEVPTPPEVAIQDLLTESLCWGCGARNVEGLQLKSYWKSGQASPTSRSGPTDRVVATWKPAPRHAAGPPHVVNGGILATLVDCHSVCAAIADAYAVETRTVGSEPKIWCATGRLELDYLRPTPIDASIHLVATVSERRGRRTVVDCVVRSGDKEVVRSRVVAVRVPLEWTQPHG